MATPIVPQTPLELSKPRQAIRTPRAAAIAGIVFAVLLITALTLVRVTVPSNPSSEGVWLADPSRRNLVLLALSLVPFAGIAFLWFIGVVRDRIGDAEDRFFATVFLGSGLLFVAMLFVGAATTAGLAASVSASPHSQLGADVWRFGRQATNTVLNIYAMRMAAVFMISTSTILLRSGIMPRWTALSGYAIAAVLLVAVGFFAWVELLFPTWVLVVSTVILVESYRTRGPVADQTASPV